MNKQPVYYMQTDSRWKNKPYRVTGENTTIGDSGCGTTCAAMLIETLTGKTFTPVDAAEWSMKRGYKALNQGTYYSYFVPQFQAFGIKCERLNTSNIYGNSGHSAHAKAFEMLKQGYYIIACMGKGNWTSSGHYIVVWWEDGKVKINDPYSKRADRINGDLKTFKSQVKYYWAVDARKYNQEGDDMTKEEVLKIIQVTTHEEEVGSTRILSITELIVVENIEQSTFIAGRRHLSFANVFDTMCTLE